MADALGPIDHPTALRGAAGVVYTGHLKPAEWTLRSASNEATISVEPIMHANNGRALALAAASGLGITYLPDFHTTDLVEAGRLVRLLPGWGEEVPVHVLFPSNRHVPLRTRTLIDFLATAFPSSGAPNETANVHVP